jgi:hypothetical protein
VLVTSYIRRAASKMRSRVLGKHISRSVFADIFGLWLAQGCACRMHSVFRLPLMRRAWTLSLRLRRCDALCSGVRSGAT